MFALAWNAIETYNETRISSMDSFEDPMLYDQ